MDARIYECFYLYYIFIQIYGQSADRIEKFNEFENTIAASLYNLLYEKIIICICKLLDPAETGNKENLTLETLLSELKNNMSVERSVEFTGLLNEIRMNAKKFKDMRDKAFAHNDREFYEDRKLLQGVSRYEIKNVLNLIDVWMNKLSLEFGKRQTIYFAENYKFLGNWFEKMLEWGLEGKKIFDNA